MIFKKHDFLEQGKYQIHSLLGKGGMGEVYLAHQVSVDRFVAIKVLYAHLTSQSTIKKRFHREAKLMAKLNHPHCITVYDFGETKDGILYIVMEYLKGHTLAEELIQKGRLNLQQTLSIIHQSCIALQRAHSLSLVHRDLKPENIYLTPQEESDEVHVTLLDFGIAKVLQPNLHVDSPQVHLYETADTLAEPLLENEQKSEQNNAMSLEMTREAFEIEETLIPTESDSSVSSSLHLQEQRRQQRSIHTQEHVLIGTPLYMSPEQTRNSEIDHRSDIYALGLIFYECLTGHPVFRGKTITDLLLAHSHLPPPKLSDTRPDLPLSLSELIEACLAKRKEDRVSEVSFIVQCIQFIKKEEPLSTSLAATLSHLQVSLQESRTNSLHKLLEVFQNGKAMPFDRVQELLKDGSLSNPSSQFSPERTAFPSETTFIFDQAVKFSISFLTLIGCFILCVGLFLGHFMWGSEDNSHIKKEQSMSGEIPKVDTLESAFYTQKGQIKRHESLLFMWDFNRNLFGQTEYEGEQIQPNFNLDHSSEHLLEQWTLPYFPDDGALRGVRFKHESYRRLVTEAFVRLPSSFTLEFWIYFNRHQIQSECKHVIMTTFLPYAHHSEYPYLCPKSQPKWKGGWGIFANVLSSRIELDFHGFQERITDQKVDSLSKSTTETSEKPVILSSPIPLFYEQWNHVALVLTDQTFTWVVNGKAQSRPFKSPFKTMQDLPLYFGSLLPPLHSSTLNMQIDDIRLVKAPIPVREIQQSYLRRLEEQKRILPSQIDHLPTHFVH